MYLYLSISKVQLMHYFTGYCCESVLVPIRIILFRFGSEKDIIIRIRISRSVLFLKFKIAWNLDLLLKTFRKIFFYKFHVELCLNTDTVGSCRQTLPPTNQILRNSSMNCPPCAHIHTELGTQQHGRDDVCTNERKSICSLNSLIYQKHNSAIFLYCTRLFL